MCLFLRISSLLCLFFFLCFAACNSDTVGTNGDTTPADGDYLENEIDTTDSDMTVAETGDGDENEIDTTESDITDIETADGDENVCPNSTILNCGDTIYGNTNADDLTNNWSAYSCSARSEGGNEKVYSFTTETRCKVEITLNDLSTDLDIFLLSSCDSFACQAFSSTPLDIQEKEQILYNTEPNKKYFLAVDGYNDSSGTYTLKVDCNCDASDGDVDEQDD